MSEAGRTFGEYVGLGAGSALFFGLWWDIREWELTDERLPRAGDIFFATIEMPVPPDFDFDCDVDLGDFSLFSGCFGGAGNPPNCDLTQHNADFDNDCDVDLSDFALFAGCFAGADNPPLDGCAWEGCSPEAGGGGESATGGGESDATEGDIVTYRNLYWMLYDYCEEHGIPFT